MRAVRVTTRWRCKVKLPAEPGIAPMTGRVGSAPVSCPSITGRMPSSSECESADIHRTIKMNLDSPLRASLMMLGLV